MQSLFRLLRKSENKISDCKAGNRIPGEAPGSAVGAGGQGVGWRLRKCFVKTSVKRAGWDTGMALHGTGRTFPTYPSGREGPFT